MLDAKVAKVYRSTTGKLVKTFINVMIRYKEGNLLFIYERKQISLSTTPFEGKVLFSGLSSDFYITYEH